MGRITNHLHVWKSLLEQAGFTLEDIPKEWDAFWSFWCDQVQPAVRRATGRDDIWGVGLSMSGGAADTGDQLEQFMAAYEADYVTRDGRLVIDDPEVRNRLIKAIDSYTAVYRKGCTPPDSVTWTNIDNNEQFLAGAVVMTPNNHALDPQRAEARAAGGLLQKHRDDRMAARPGRRAFPDRRRRSWPAVAFKDGGNTDAAKEFVRFLVAEGWLAHYLDFSGERMLPAMPKLLDQPFWLDPSDPHRMAAVMQVASRPDAIRLRRGLRQPALRPDLAGGRLGEGDPPRRRRGHQPRAGGRRGDRAHQADPQRVTEQTHRAETASGRSIMWSRILGLAAAVMLAPLAARAADLVVWWDKGSRPGGRGVQEIVSAFEQETGKEVELGFHQQAEFPDEIVAGARGRTAARLRLRHTN